MSSGPHDMSVQVPRPVEALALTVPQVAALLNLGRSTVFELIAKGVLPARVIVGKRRVLRKDLERWLDQQPVA